MDWPLQNPDLNTVEAVRDAIDRKRNKRQPDSTEELQEVLDAPGIINQKITCENFKMASLKEL